VTLLASANFCAGMLRPRGQTFGLGLGLGLMVFGLGLETRWPRPYSFCAQPRNSLSHSYWTRWC